MTCICIVSGARQIVKKKANLGHITGIASWYNDDAHAKKTANGETLSQKIFTCATNRYQMGTLLRVTNIRTGKSVVVKVNDRMHRNSKRIVDLTYAAARKLGIGKSGIIRVRVENLGLKQP